MKQKNKSYVFVSYSWDSESHKDNVRKFVQTLRSDGIDVVYDGDLELGERLQHFMERSIAKSDIVLFICTPNYKYRADNRISGVGYESEIISNELYETCNEKKFIPVLFSGTWENSLPIWSKGKLGIDLSTNELYESGYPKLLSQLQNELLNNKLTLDTSIENKKLNQERKNSQLDTPELKRKVIKFLRDFGDVATFKGVTFSGILVGVILLFITPVLSNIANPVPRGANTDDAFYNSQETNSTEPNDVSEPDTTKSSDIPEPDTTESSGIPEPDTTESDGIPESHTTESNSIPESDTTNFHTMIPDNTTYPDGSIISTGTMPKGTAPIEIPLTEETEKLLTAIQKISIGTSKDWIDDNLGLPFVLNTIAITENERVRPNTDKSNIVGEVLECIYIFDILSMKIYFDIPGNACIAYFVTLLDDISEIDIIMPQVYAGFVSDKPLGSFAYSEITGEPDYVYGYAGQGIARTFYGEKYYFMASGNYQNFYFATLDYGMLNSLADFVRFISVIQFDIAPSNETTDFLSSDLLSCKRDIFYPNTYGVSVLNEYLTFDLFGSYSGFDSLPLRGWD